MAGGSGDMGLPGVWDCSGFTLFQLCYIGAQIFPHCSIHHMYSADIGGTLCNQGGALTLITAGPRAPHVQLNKREKSFFPVILWVRGAEVSCFCVLSFVFLFQKENILGNLDL